MVKNVIHIIVFFSIFSSSTGLWINSHYCQRKLVKTSLFLNFGSCCSEEASDLCTTEKMTCSDQNQDEKDNNNCCDNKSSYHKLDQNQFIQDVKLNTSEETRVLNAIIATVSTQRSSIDQLNVHYLNYLPPLIVYNRQVRLQTFLC